MDPILAQLSASLPNAKSLEDLTRPLLDMLGAVTGLESTYLTSIDLEKGEQHIRYARNTGEMNIPEGLTVPWSDTLCRRALEEDRMYTDDVGSCWGDSGAARQLGIQTYVSAPVRSEDGALLGTLCGASARQQPLKPDAETVLRLFSNIVAGYIERERLLDSLKDANNQLHAYAMTDTLTGLPNRRSLFESLQRLLAQGIDQRSSVLVGVIDLDGFKAINDNYGHQCGDQFLQQIAKTLSAALGPGDVLGRIGGDEFVVAGPGPTLAGSDSQPGRIIDNGSPQAAAKLMQDRIGAATIGRHPLGERWLDYGGASVGIVAVEPTGLGADAAVRLADSLMYEIKRTRKRSIRER
ncbi:signalling protein [Bordetella ansorpii]|uniref:Signalling protein n=1 Tax=Bordetella ansorpii TaxID=288768 RepID=A0A157SG62_9BORD|nr:sensor domain-containing diguanylate cyclase [Bordetella ansorpii]SAI69430.1 signalling protein [Bordetella ansorpii]